VKKELWLARETLELGALVSIRSLGAVGSVRSQDVAAFERHVAQLKPYYYDSIYTSMLGDSERKWLILGLYLLGLLAHNRIAEFHTELELIPYKDAQTNMFIKYPVQLEQRLMEGSYNKILTAKNAAPAQYYNVFVDLLVNTVRERVSDCCAAAYESFPVEDARALLLFSSGAELNEFVKKKGWELKKDIIYFNRPKDSKLDIPSHVLIKQTLSYATELERIV
jgi:26S proteasome regulatory subunit N12